MTVLKTHDIYFAYGRHKVLNGLDLVVPRGEVYGFLGRNGAGKTTTLQILLGILVPGSGTLDFGGKTVRRMSPSLKQRIGYVSQSQHFYEWMKVKRLASFVSGFYPMWSQKDFNRLIQDLSIDANQKVGTLSGGTKMKLAMALALATQPELLVLDEPTAGVDPIARREILDLLRKVAKDEGKTVLFSTHHIDEVEEIGDNVGVLHDGELVYQDRVDGLVAFAREKTGKSIEDLEGAFLALVASDLT